VAVRQAALVSDESALKACLRWCAVQIDDLLKWFHLVETSALRRKFLLSEMAERKSKSEVVYCSSLTNPGYPLLSHC